MTSQSTLASRDDLLSARGWTLDIGPNNNVESDRDVMSRVAQEKSGLFVRIYQPNYIVAFSSRDRSRVGFDRAIEVAISQGFMPVMRAPGGQAVAYHPESLCLELFSSAQNPHAEIERRFQLIAELMQRTLSRFGVNLEIGETPDEYCPGRYSLNFMGKGKVVGTAQRINSGAWMFGAGIICSNPAPLREVLRAVYAELDLAFLPETILATGDISPLATVENLKDALVAELDLLFGIHKTKNQNYFSSGNEIR